VSQPGRPDKPDAFWHELPAILARAWMNPTMAGAILAPFKGHVLALKADLYREFPAETADRVFELVRDHLYGHLPPGA
jgi:hypothetical protein